jgi:hypothetical protein
LISKRKACYSKWNSVRGSVVGADCYDLVTDGFGGEGCDGFNRAIQGKRTARFNHDKT